MIRRLLNRHRRSDITLIVDLPSGLVADAADDLEAWVTRLVRETTADRAETSPGGETTATLPPGVAAPVGEPSPPGETTVVDSEGRVWQCMLDMAHRDTDTPGRHVPCEYCRFVGDGDVLRAEHVDEALRELAATLARVAIPDADIDSASPAFRDMFRRYAEAVALAGWRPPLDAAVAA